MTEYEYNQFKQQKKSEIKQNKRSWPVTIIAGSLFILSLLVGYESILVVSQNPWLAIVGVVFSLGLALFTLTVTVQGTVKSAIDNLALFLIGLLINPV